MADKEFPTDFAAATPAGTLKLLCDDGSANKTVLASEVAALAQATLTFRDEGTDLSNDVTKVDFVGGGVTAAYDAGTKKVTVTIPSVTGFTDEAAQDAVGAMAANSARVTLTYADATPALTADLVADSVTAGYLHASATDKLFGRSSSGAGAGEEITCTAAGRALIDDADAAAQRNTLGLGSIATQASNNVTITGGSVTGITDIAVADGGTGVSTLAANGVVYGNGTSAVGVTAAGADFEFLRGTTGGAPVFGAYQRSTEVDLYDDWGGVNGGALPWNIGLSGGTFVAPGTNGDGSYGEQMAASVSAATDRVLCRFGTGAILFGTGTWTMRSRLKLVTLSTASQEYVVRHGFGDASASTDHVDGAYFEYDRATSGDFWVCKTSSNSSRTTTVTATAVDTNYHIFEIAVNAAGTSVDFKIDGVTVATITTNIPTATNRSHGMSYQGYKTVGTSAVNMFVIDITRLRFKATSDTRSFG